jgi:hypothetical protein
MESMEIFNASYSAALSTYVKTCFNSTERMFNGCNKTGMCEYYCAIIVTAEY